MSFRTVSLPERSRILTSPVIQIILRSQSAVPFGALPGRVHFSYSFSILTFTLERYIAICHPMLAYRICTTERTNSIILAVWIVAILYCCPWLALTEVKGDPYDPYVEYCTFRLSKHQYTIFFICDLVVFYIVPLCVAFAVYARIAAKMAQPRKNTLRTSLDSSSVCYDAATTSVRMKRRSACVSEGVSMPQAKCRSSVSSPYMEQYGNTSDK